MADPILVVVFLRGGIDGLNLISPSGDENLIAARPEGLRVPRKGDQPGLALKHQAADVDFRLHPQAAKLAELFDANELAIIHASGLTDGTRSHFDAEDRMERAAKQTNAGGWLARWIAQTQPTGDLPILAVGAGAPESLRGANETAVAESLDDLLLPGGHDLAHAFGQRMLDGFGDNPLLGQPVRQLVHLSEKLGPRLIDPNTDEEIPYRPSADYPERVALARSLMTVAQAIKMDLGLRIATVDFGGWDTHVHQEYYFQRQVRGLSHSISAFWRDLGNAAERTTVIVMSEFGRRLRANTAGGTDHGFGNAMMVLGGQVRGGQMLGDWPGLAHDQLDKGADLAITTDYRHVLSEVLVNHMGAPNMDAIFPGFERQPVGLI